MKHSLCVAVATCLALSVSPAMAAPKDVNVVNEPNVSVVNTPDVNVANTPDVNVANTPNVAVANEPNVNVVSMPPLTIVSDPATPIVTLDRDAAGRAGTFSYGWNLRLRPPDQESSTVLVRNDEIPPGSALVIDGVGLNVVMDEEQDVTFSVRHLTPGSTFTRIVYRDVIGPLRLSFRDSWYGASTIGMPLYLEHDASLPGDTRILEVSAHRRETTGDVTVDFYVSGHFVPKLP